MSISSLNKLNSHVAPLLLLWGFFVLSANSVNSQEKIRTEIPYGFSQQPMNAEINIIRLEAAGKLAQSEADKDKITFAIARLGTGELSGRLNSRRLHNVREFLKSYIPAEQIIVAEGERVKGYGRVELYIGGRLIDVLLVERQKDLHVECCDGDERFYPNRK